MSRACSAVNLRSALAVASLESGMIISLLPRSLFGARGASIHLGVLPGAWSEGAVAGYGLAHDQGVYVVRALVGVNPFEVGHVLHHAVVEQDAVAPERVARRGGDLARLGDVVHLEQRDGRRVELSRVLDPPYVDGEELAQGDLVQHRDQLLLNELERGYGLPELGSLSGVGERGLVAVRRLPQGVPADPVARVRQDRERRAEARGARQAVLLGDAAVFKGDVGLPDGALGAFAREYLGTVARRALLDEEAPYTAVLGSGPDHDHVGEGGVADPALLPVQDVAAVSGGGGRREGAGVAPGAGLGEGEGPDLLAPGHRGQPLLLLLLAPELVDRSHREPALDVQESRQASRPARHLRYGQPVGHVVPAGAIVLLPEAAARDAQLAEGGHELERELGPVPVLGGGRDHLPVHELPHPVPDPPLLLGEQAVRLYEVRGLRRAPDLPRNVCHRGAFRASGDGRSE